MQHKIKTFLIIGTACTALVAFGLLQTSRNSIHAQSIKLFDQKMPTTGSVAVNLFHNPLPKNVADAFNAHSRRSQAVEKEARSLLKESRFAEAEAACYRALALSPKINGQPSSMEALQLLGDVYREQGHYKDAIDTYNKARQHTRNLELDCNIALSYVKLGDLNSARKFFSEEKAFGNMVDLPPQQKAQFLAQLPGTKTAKSFEASIYFARGKEKGSYAALDEAVENYQKALRLVPHNALIARHCAWDLDFLGRSKEATPLWARAAAFGTGDVAHEGLFELKQRMTESQAKQAMRDAKKIR